MNNAKNFILLFFLLFAYTESVSNETNIDVILKDKSDECREKVTELDSLAKRIIFMDNNRLMPTNETLREKYCAPLKKVTKVIKQTLKCTTPFVGQVLNVFGNGLRKPIRYICSSPLKQIKPHYQCMDEIFIKQLNTLEANFMDSLYALYQTNISRDFILPGLCCSIHNLAEQVKTGKYENCQIPDSNPSKFLYDRLDEALKDVLDLICAPYPSSQICEEKGSEIMKLLKQYERGYRELQYEHFVPSLLLVVGRLATD